MTPSIRYTATDAASRFLAEADPAMGALIDRVGGVEFTPALGSDRFSMLVRGIVGQQLSDAAARRIFARLAEEIGMRPELLASANDEALLAAGLSHHKSEYVRDLARAVVACEVDLEGLDELTDDEIVEQLTRVRGIGPWTVHMFLLFALRRPDVIAPGDLGIRQAIGRLLGLGREASPAEVTAAAQRWRPYRSAATFYLYRDGGMGEAAADTGSERPSAE